MNGQAGQACDEGNIRKRVVSRIARRTRSFRTLSGWKDSILRRRLSCWRFARARRTSPVGPNRPAGPPTIIIQTATRPILLFVALRSAFFPAYVDGGRPARLIGPVIVIARSSSPILSGEGEKSWRRPPPVCCAHDPLVAVTLRTFKHLQEYTMEPAT